MKIALCEFYQEIDSFNPISTTFADYKQGGIFEGEELLLYHRYQPTSLHGMITAIEEYGGTILPIIAMSAQSGGPIEQSVLDFFIDKTLSALRIGLPLDGVFVSLHGATQTTEIDDVCGEILEKIRNTIGPDIVISVSVDLHGNISEKMVRNADFICGYDTYPHVDIYETGYRAAKFGLMKISGEKSLKMAMASIPMIAPASAYSSVRGVFKDVMDQALSLVTDKKIADISVFMMQPWLDVFPAQSTILCIADNAETAKYYANKVAQHLFSVRHEIIQDLWAMEDVFAQAESNDSGKPYILVDASDSPNAGATGDSAALLELIQRHDSSVRAALYVTDDHAVDQAFRIGIGGEGSFTIGASRDPNASNPVTITAKVVSLHDGVFLQEGPAQRGALYDIGHCAVLHWKNTDILVCHTIFASGDPQIYRHFGIEPTFYQLVNVKACTSWRAAYEPMAEKIFETDTPGNAPLNLFRLKYTHLPRHFYPFEEIGEKDIRAAEIFTE